MMLIPPYPFARGDRSVAAPLLALRVLRVRSATWVVCQRSQNLCSPCGVSTGAYSLSSLGVSEVVDGSQENISLHLALTERSMMDQAFIGRVSRLKGLGDRWPGFTTTAP